jgi:hypothetical protein
MISTGLNSSGMRENLIGEFGAYATFYSIRNMGLSYWLIPLALIFASYTLLFPDICSLRKRRMFAMILIIFSAAGICEFVHQRAMTAEGFLKFSQNTYSGELGGIIGTYIFYYFMEPIFGEIGSIVILVTVLILSFVYTLARNTSLNAALEPEIEKYGYFRAIIFGNIWRAFVLLLKAIKLLFKLLFKLFVLIFKKAAQNSTVKDCQVFGKKAQNVEKSPSLNMGVPNSGPYIEKRSGDYIFPTLDLL